jgi:hypothetical protein
MQVGAMMAMKYRITMTLAVVAALVSFLGQDADAWFGRRTRARQTTSRQPATATNWNADAVRRLQTRVEYQLSVGTRVRSRGLRETVRFDIDRNGLLTQPRRLAGRIVDAILRGRRVKITAPFFRPYKVKTLDGLNLWAETVRRETPRLREAQRPKRPIPNGQWRPDRWTQWNIPRPRGGGLRDGEGEIPRAVRGD